MRLAGLVVLHELDVGVLGEWTLDEVGVSDR